jgi:hypothetical protein
MSVGVQYIDSSPPTSRTRRVLRNGPVGKQYGHLRLSVPAVDIYSLRPTSLEDVTFCDYFTQYRVYDGDGTPRGGTLCGQAMNGQRVFRLSEPRMVRFTDFNPAVNPEGFFYNLLLRKVPFRHEPSLLSEDNASQTYYEECQRRALFTDMNDLERFVEA